MRLVHVLPEAGVTILLSLFVSYSGSICRHRACDHGLTRRKLVQFLDFAEQLESHVN